MPNKEEIISHWKPCGIPTMVERVIKSDINKY
jgi:hypothetical protein